MIEPYPNRPGSVKTRRRQSGERDQRRRRL